MPFRQLDPHGRFDQAVALSCARSSTTSLFWSSDSVPRNAVEAATTSATALGPPKAAPVDNVELDVLAVDVVPPALLDEQPLIAMAIAAPTTVAACHRITRVRCPR